MAALPTTSSSSQASPTPGAARAPAAAASERLPRRRYRGLRKFARNRAAVAGALIVVFAVFVALFAPWLSPTNWGATCWRA